MILTQQSEALLLWVANKGHGSFSDLLTPINWLARVNNIENLNPWDVVNGLEKLGYIHRDPGGNGWEALGKQLVMLPGREGLAIFTGCFDRKLTLDEFDEYGFWTTYIPATLDPVLSWFLPTSMYVEASDITAFSDYQRATGCAYFEVETYLRLLCANDDLQLTQNVAPPRYDTGDLERYNLKNLSYEPTTTGSVDGLYRQRVNGRLMYWILSDGEWYRSDRGTGPWFHRSLVSGINEYQRHAWYAAKTESIYFNRRIPIPRKLENLLTLCSGLLPVDESMARRFDNVNPELAHRVFDYLKLDY